MKLLHKASARLTISILLFVLFTAGITYVIARPFDRIYSNDNRFQIAFLGASESEWGINPILIDETTQKKSYLLATSGCTYEYRYEMLRSALQQDSLELVVVEVSYGSMKKNMDTFDLDSKLLIFPRISGIVNKLHTAFRKFSFWEDDFDRIYAEEVYEGMKAWDSKRTGIYPLAFAMHGYVPQECASQLLTREEAGELHDSSRIAKIRNKNLEALGDIIDLCQENAVDVMLITLPVSESYLWRYAGWDDFHDAVSDLAAEKSVDYYDYNLWTNRQKFLSDETSFRDEEHMCDAGSLIFTPVLGALIDHRFRGQAPADQFYYSYTEAKEHSAYAEMLP